MLAHLVILGIALQVGTPAPPACGPPVYSCPPIPGLGAVAVDENGHWKESRNGGPWENLPAGVPGILDGPGWMQPPHAAKQWEPWQGPIDFSEDDECLWQYDEYFWHTLKVPCSDLPALIHATRAARAANGGTMPSCSDAGPSYLWDHKPPLWDATRAAQQQDSQEDVPAIRKPVETYGADAYETPTPEFCDPEQWKITPNSCALAIAEAQDGSRHFTCKDSTRVLEHDADNPRHFWCHKPQTNKAP